MSSHSFQADWLSGEDGAKSGATSTSKSKNSAASWQALGVNAPLVRALNLRGFKNPTPIQRSTIPLTLSISARDILGMARTGSGKTLAYLIPLLQRLGGTRNESAGIRGLIMCPSRELAVQVLKVGKDLSRSLATGEDKAQALRWSIIMGGESLDAQFEAMSSKPDIIIATPGRFLHLVVEMEQDLRSIQMVVYDEADRLFEMGFELQLREILHRLPANRHSLLFSATLPSSLAEFAKAGLNNPELVRLDTEHRVSPDLNLAFFSVKPDEKEAGLLTLLREVIQVPLASTPVSDPPKGIIFASTKHHVEYLSVFLQAAGYRVSYIYGSLDQLARQQQLRLFRQGLTELLVVTDVAARGLDIPAMGHVINYDFPAGVRVFVHRVGRTARAGQQGHAWSLVTRDDMPYLRDLETFLERPLIADGIYGTMPRDRLETAIEYIYQSLDTSETQLPSLRTVMKRGQSMYERSRTKASRDAYKTAKALSAAGRQVPIHPAFNNSTEGESPEDEDDRNDLLAAIQSYQPQETIFEIGTRGQHTAALLMKQRRATISQHRKKRPAPTNVEDDAEAIAAATADKSSGDTMTTTRKNYRDPNFFMPHENHETNREKGYSLKEGTTFAEQARSSTLDLANDEGAAQRAQKASQMKWDRKKKRFIKGDGVGDDNKKMIRGESGALLPATFKSGRYAEWKRQTRHTPGKDTASAAGSTGPHRRHTSTRAPAGGLATAESILKDRRKMDKRKQKNGRAPHKRR